MNSTRGQLEGDRGEGRSDVRMRPDDVASPRRLRRTTGSERAHRDRGSLSDSPRIQEINRSNAD